MFDQDFFSRKKNAALHFSFLVDVSQSPTGLLLPRVRERQLGA